VAALAPEASRGDQLLLQQRRAVARVLEEGGVDAAGHGEVHVVADQVHQLERPHAETAGVAVDRVEGGDVGHPLLQQAQRLGVVGPRDAVDDEAGRGGDAHRPLAPGARGGLDRRAHGRVAGQAVHHLDQRHQRDRVEEVHADQAAGPLQPGTERRDRQ